MKKKIFNLGIILSLSFALTILSCKKEEVVDTTIDTIVDKASFSIDSTTGTGKYGCFTFVYPVSFTMPDGSALTINSDEEMRTALKNYIKDKQGKGQNCDSLRPKIVFPITILTDSGVSKTISNEDELKALRESCHKDYFQRGDREHRGHGKNRDACFKINFPVTVILPDSTTQIAADEKALKDIGKAWKQAHPNAASHPRLVFPINVTKKDGSIVTVNSAAELKALKDACS